MVNGVGMQATFGHIFMRVSACYCLVLFFITQVHFICLEKRRLNSNLGISFLPLNHTHNGSITGPYVGTGPENDFNKWSYRNLVQII